MVSQNNTWGLQLVHLTLVDGLRCGYVQLAGHASMVPSQHMARLHHVLLKRGSGRCHCLMCASLAFMGAAYRKKPVHSAVPAVCTFCAVASCSLCGCRFAGGRGSAAAGIRSITGSEAAAGYYLTQQACIRHHSTGRQPCAAARDYWYHCKRLWQCCWRRTSWQWTSTIWWRWGRGLGTCSTWWSCKLRRNCCYSTYPIAIRDKRWIPGGHCFWEALSTRGVHGTGFWCCALVGLSCDKSSIYSMFVALSTGQG